MIELRKKKGEKNKVRKEIKNKSQKIKQIESY
jgi:hypothetical protein